jgi:hypothetical protein
LANRTALMKIAHNETHAQAESGSLIADSLQLSYQRDNPFHFIALPW